MAWHHYTFVVIGLTASLCVQIGNSNGISTGLTPSPSTVCDTHECQRAANGMIKKMNLAVNPCEDFNEFACGRFIKESKIPDGGTEVTTFSLIADENQARYHDILKAKVEATDPQYLINIKRFFNSCMDEDTIEAVGLTPYLNEWEFVDDWPTLNPNWSGANFDLNEVIVRYSKVFVNPIFGMDFMNDFNDSNSLAISLYDASVTLNQVYYSQPRNSSILQAYENYLIEFAVALNASREVAEQDVKDVIDLEIEITKIMVSPADRRDTMKMNNPVRLNQLSKMYPELDIVGFARTLFRLVNITLTGNEKVINLYPTFIGNISTVVQEFSNRTLQNLFGFNYAKKRVGGLTRRMRQILHDFLKVYQGRATETPRLRFCLEKTLKLFPMAISRQYVNMVFSERAKRDVNDMIDNMKEVFKKMIEDTTWMSNDTKTEALVKLAAMNRQIGYPDVDFEEADIDKLYKQHIMKKEDYYGSYELADKLNKLAHLAEYGKPVNKNKWMKPPHEINAYYYYPHNEIVFLAGIMNQPMYNETFPDYLNYGAIGSIIGHEITHGFDDTGKGYDENGNLRDWWTPEDKESFDNKAWCIIDQNSNTPVDEVNMTLNGINTQGESIADNGGIKVAFRAYKNHVSKSGLQPRLPDLLLSQDQMFFLSFAQVHCAKYTPQRLMQRLREAPHPPGKYRTLLILQNTEDFAEVYNCPKGSSMNPTDRCNVWQPSDLLLRSRANRRVPYSLGLALLKFAMLMCYINLVRVLTF